MGWKAACQSAMSGWRFQITLVKRFWLDFVLEICLIWFKKCQELCHWKSLGTLLCKDGLFYASQQVEQMKFWHAMI